MLVLLGFLLIGLITMEFPRTERSTLSDESPTSVRIDFGRITPLEFPMLTIETFIISPLYKIKEFNNINNVITLSKWKMSKALVGILL